MALQKPNITKPTVGQSIDIWGGELNIILDQLDSFNSKIVEDSSNQDQEITRLDREKINQSDIDTVVQVTVDNYVDQTSKPSLNTHVETVNKPELDRYTNTKKSEIDTFTEEQKVELNTHEKEKEVELDNYNTSVKKPELDAYEKVKETEITSHTNKEIARSTQEISDKSILEQLEIRKKGQEELDKLATAGVDGVWNEIDFSTGNEFKFERDEESENPIGATSREREYTLGQLVDRHEKDKQEKEDLELNTTDKTVVGAINELLVGKENNIVRSSDVNNVSETDVATSKAVKTLNENKAEKSIQVIAGKGLTGGGDLSSNRTLNIASADEGIIVNDNDIKLNIVDDLMTGGVKRPLSAEQGKVIKQLIDAIGGGGVARLMRQAEVLSEYDYIGNLPSNGTSIAVGTQLFDPTLYLNGIRIESNKYSVELTTGLITLISPYSDTYDVIWVVEDQMPHHISFCFPTMNLLLSNEDMKSKIELGNVIKLLGLSDADDGGHYLVKCESTAKLNAVEIGVGKYLNEIPNTRISTLKQAIDQNKSDILLKADKSDIVNNLLGGVDKMLSAEQGKVLLGEISKASSGWCKFANGLIVQWGRGVIIRGKYNTIFPVAFSAIPKITYNIIHPSEENIIIDAKIASCIVSGATFTSNYMRSDLNIKSTNENEFFWIAIGY